MPKKETKISSSVEKNVEIVDIFNGVQLKWKLGSKQVQEQVFESVFRFARIQGKPVGKSEVRFFDLGSHKKYKQIVLDSYIPHVSKKSEEISEEKKTSKLFALKDRNSLRGYVWQSVNLGHPATFDTMAVDFDVKKMIMDDLEMFLKRKDFHRRVGKAWKCGYLLFGPPGRGKSSLIAGMANFLNFDVYDLELSALLRGNMELRNLLIATENKSLLVVEDIDCSIELQNRHAQALAVNPMVSNMNYTARPGINQGPQFQVTLSGLLNFIDGLWSSCGDERIMVFTTNQKEKLDLLCCILVLWMCIFT